MTNPSSAGAATDGSDAIVTERPLKTPQAAIKSLAAQTKKITSADAANGFGQRVAISGDTAVVGMWIDTVTGGDIDGVATVDGNLFVDGFESGDTGAWSGTF